MSQLSNQVPTDEEWSQIKCHSHQTHTHIQRKIEAYCDEYDPELSVGSVDIQGLRVWFRFDGKLHMVTEHHGNINDYGEVRQHVTDIKHSISGLPAVTS